ncbi:hypothetical protein Sango_2616500 [Sesamum angolense]|uniref:Uncharacterized protein n=1 Tax=Sesamum angolense TaxID=2727404 RepID=A0AAE1W1G3_9LAMI|nr:hypothetical protein Sango_2616500 [Sesamum angolense]
MSKATLKKTMDDLTKELEKVDQVNQAGSTCNEHTVDERDPLFVANVGDYYSNVSKTGSARWATCFSSTRVRHIAESSRVLKKKFLCQ